jgi:hypothetical protein
MLSPHSSAESGGMQNNQLTRSSLSILKMRSNPSRSIWLNSCEIPPAFARPEGVVKNTSIASTTPDNTHARWLRSPRKVARCSQSAVSSSPAHRLDRGIRPRQRTRADSENPMEAFARCEHRMRPFARKNQDMLNLERREPIPRYLRPCKKCD